MINISLLAGNTTAGTAIPFSQNINTNNNIKTSGSSIQIVKPGVYEIVGNATVLSTAIGTYGISINANDAQIGNPGINLAAAAAEETTVPIYAIVTIKSSTENDYATINLMPVGAPTIVGGTVSIKLVS